MKRWQWLGIVVLAAYALVSIVTGARHALGPQQSQDFAPIYMAAKLWRVGQDPYAERSTDEWQRITDARVAPVAPIDRAYSTPYAPFALLVAAPLGGLDWPAARASWLALNLGLAIYVPWLVYRLWLRTPARSAATAAFFAVWFGGMGLRVGLANGQHVLVWFAAMLSAFWLMTRDRPWWAGLPLALSLHKYPLTVPFLPYFLLNRSFRLLAAGAFVALAALAIFAIGLRVDVVDVARSFQRELAWWYDQSGPSGGITDVRPVLAAAMSPALAAPAMYLVVGAATLAACWPTDAGVPIPRGIDIAAVLLLMLVATYHRVYDTVVLIVPLLTLAAAARDAAGWRRSALRGLVGLLALIWYADPSSLYRRVVPVPLDQVPEGGIFFALDLGYRLVIAAAFLVTVALRFQPLPARALILAPRPS
jgi:hypothetical protein